MKHIISILALITTAQITFGQVAFGKNSVTEGKSILLEFSQEEPRGMLLPWVDSENAVINAVPGTIIYDVSDFKVKFLKGGKSLEWIDLSIDSTGKADLSLQNGLEDQPTARVIIGEDNTDAPGILVLESQEKAMVLPKVDAPYDNIINPSAGMMVYDKTRKQLAVFNGTVWTFWTY